MAEVTVSNEELKTVREAMRELNQMIGSLDRGSAQKFVLTQRSQMRAVVVSVSHYSELQQRAQQQAA